MLSGEEDVVLAGELGRGRKLVLFPFFAFVHIISSATDCGGEPSIGSGMRLEGKLGLHGQAGGSLSPAEGTH